MKEPVFITEYEEFTGDPSTWTSPKPIFDVEKFNKELERRAGSIGSIPRFRLRWAGNLDEYLLDGYSTLEGYTYMEDGQEKFVSVKDVDFELPDGAVWAPVREDHFVFIPRFVVEEFNQEKFEYEKAWIIETQARKREEDRGGLIIITSSYRQPAEIDFQMAEHLSYLRRTLNADDIRNGIERLRKLKARADGLKSEEFIDNIAHATVQGVTDGFTNPIRFDIGKSFNIREFTNKKLEELNAKIC